MLGSDTVALVGYVRSPTARNLSVGSSALYIGGLPEVTLVYRPRDQGILAGVYGSAHMTRALLMHDIDSQLSYHRHASKKKILNPSRGVYFMSALNEWRLAKSRAIFKR